MDFKKIYREANSEKEKLLEEAYSIIKPFIDKLGDLSQFHYEEIFEGSEENYEDADEWYEDWQTWFTSHCYVELDDSLIEEYEGVDPSNRF